MTAAAVAVAALAAACFEGAYVLQALEARRTAPADGLRPRLLGRLARRPLWLGGIALSVGGALAQVGALSLGSLTVVQATLALGLVVLLGLARVVLGEEIRRGDVVAVALLVAGVILAAVAAPGRETSAGDAVATAVALVVLGLLAAAPYARRGEGRRLAVLGAGAGDAWAAIGLKLLSDALADGRWAVAVAWAAGSALAAVAALTSEMSALQRLPASRVGPAVFGCAIVVPIALAPLVAGERWGDTPGGGAVLAVAVVLVAAGGGRLATRTAP